METLLTYLILFAGYWLAIACILVGLRFSRKGRIIVSIVAAALLVSESLFLAALARIGAAWSGGGNSLSTLFFFSALTYLVIVVPYVLFAKPGEK